MSPVRDPQARRWSTTRTDWFERLALASRAKLLLAIFFTFAPTAILVISRFEEKRSVTALATYAILGGFTAAGWAFTFMRSKWFLVILLPSQLLWFVLPASLLRADFRSGFTFSLEGSACILLIVAGYLLFVSFIAGEGVKSVRMSTELALAGEIHESLVPPVDLSTARLELFGRSIASSEMGGDLLDVTATDGRVGICVADVSGHGVKAGVVMAMTKAAARMRLRTTAELDDLLPGLNRVLHELTEPGMFVTAACMLFDGVDSPDGPLRTRFVGAGHGSVFHFRAVTGTVKKLDSESLPLGIVEGEPFAPRDVAVATGDVLLFMTDGLFEVLDADDRPFGEAAIEGLFVGHAALPLAELYAKIMNAVRAHGRQTDDQTLLLIRIR